MSANGCRISAQKSEASFSSQQRPRETSEVTQEPSEEQEQPEPQTFKEKFLGKLKSLSILPSPNQALETFREESGLALASISPLHWEISIAKPFDAICSWQSSSLSQMYA